jgi:hypothetical protein
LRLNAISNLLRFAEHEPALEDPDLFGLLEFLEAELQQDILAEIEFVAEEGIAREHGGAIELVAAVCSGRLEILALFLAAARYAVVEVQSPYGRVRDFEDRVEDEVRLVTQRCIIVFLFVVFLVLCDASVAQVGYFLVGGALAHLDAAHDEEEVIRGVLDLVLGRVDLVVVLEDERFMRVLELALDDAITLLVIERGVRIGLLQNVNHRVLRVHLEITQRSVVANEVFDLVVLVLVLGEEVPSTEVGLVAGHEPNLGFVLQELERDWVHLLGFDVDLK